jgi:3-hydroxybutyryl-CoA dehydrogenase
MPSIKVRYAIVQNSVTFSLPEGHALLIGSSPADTADVVMVELGLECLAVHVTDERRGDIRRLVGFARYRNGADPPSNLIEVVRLRETADEAVAAARALFEASGFAVSVCFDQPGRIIDRLVRPKYNVALNLADEGLATEHDFDLACRLGLGYPDGPIERVVRGGLAHHCEVTKALFDAFGTTAYVPARRAAVAAARKSGLIGS